MTSKEGISDSMSSDAVSGKQSPLLAVLESHERDVSTFYRWAVPPIGRDYAQEAAVVQGSQGPGSPGWAIVNMDKCRNLIADKHLVHGELGDCVDTKLKAALASCYGGAASPQTDVELLETCEDVPKREEWTVLAEQFPSVRWLYVETGFCENWEDSLFPQQWPLEALVVSSSCGETFTTPVILDGRVPHLVLFLTSGARFEGPTTSELTKKPPSRMHTLEILENDAADTLIAMSMACAHVVHHLRRINLRSTSGLDFSRFDCDTLPQLLEQLTNLRELQLTVSDVTFRVENNDDSGSPEDTVLHTLYQHFPPNLEVLEFRGPPSLATSAVFQDWIAAFGNTAGGFLPRLKRLSFVLDASFSEHRTDEGKPQPPSEDEIAAAAAPTRALLDAAHRRGIIVEEFHDPWREGSHML